MKRLILGAALLLGASTAAARVGRPTITSQEQLNLALEDTCPIEVPGANVRAAPVPDGVSLSFSTPVADQVEALQAKVAGLADLDRRTPRSTGPLAPVKNTPSVRRTKDGAQLVLAPADARDLRLLRSRAYAYASAMQQNAICKWRPDVP